MKFRRIKMVVVLSLLLVVTTAAESRSQSWFNLRHGSDALNANSIIYTICTDTADNIYAAGNFTDSTDPSLGYPYVAKWDAALQTWSSLGVGSHALKPNGTIGTVCTDQMGNVYAGGIFTNGVWPGGYRYVAKWDGSNWNEIGSLNANGPIKSICADKNGNVYAAGNFRNSSGRYYVAKWDGTSWNDLGRLDANLYINVICVDDSQNVYAGGNFTNGSGETYVARYNPTTNNWSNVGTGFYSVSAGSVINSMFTDTPGHVCIALNITSASGTSSNIFKWNGSNWRSLGLFNGNSYILTICKGDSGSVYASGSFTNTSGEHYVAKYDPVSDSWGQLGNLYLHSHYDQKAPVSAMCVDKLGRLYAAGGFTDSMSPTNNFKYVARYGAPPPGLWVAPIINETSIDVYPNPAKDVINIQCSNLVCMQNVSYNIIDCMGRIVYCDSRNAQIGNRKIPIDISDLPTGLYALKINGTQSTLVRFIKH